MQDYIGKTTNGASAAAPANQKEKAQRVRLGNRHVHLPRSRVLRIVIGVALIIGGLVGFLPVVGFWMIPLGILVLSVDLPWARRMRRRFVVWWHRRWGKKRRNGKD